MKLDRILFLKELMFCIFRAVIALLILAWNLKNSFEFGRLAFVPLFMMMSPIFRDKMVQYQKFIINGNVFLS